MYNSFMGEWAVQESEKQLECKVHFRNIYPDIAGVRWSAALFLANFLQGFNENSRASPCLFILKAAYLFTAAENSDLEASCLPASWVLLLLSQCSFSHRLALLFAALIPSISIKNNPLPQNDAVECAPRLKSSSIVFHSFSSSWYKIRSLKELPVYSIFLLDSNYPLPGHMFHIRLAMK